MPLPNLFCISLPIDSKYHAVNYHVLKWLVASPIALHRNIV